MTSPDAARSTVTAETYRSKRHKAKPAKGRASRGDVLHEPSPRGHAGRPRFLRHGAGPRLGLSPRCLRRAGHPGPVARHAASSWNARQEAGVQPEPVRPSESPEPGKGGDRHTSRPQRPAGRQRASSRAGAGSRPPARSARPESGAFPCPAVSSVVGAGLGDADSGRLSAVFVQVRPSRVGGGYAGRCSRLRLPSRRPLSCHCPRGSRSRLPTFAPRRAHGAGAGLFQTDGAARAAARRLPHGPLATCVPLPVCFPREFSGRTGTLGEPSCAVRPSSLAQLLSRG